MTRIFETIGASPWLMFLVNVLASGLLGWLFLRYGDFLTRISRGRYLNRILFNVNQIIDVVSSMKTGAAPWAAALNLFYPINYGFALFALFTVLAQSRPTMIMIDFNDNWLSIGLSLLFYFVSIVAFYRFFASLRRLFIYATIALDPRNAIVKVRKEVSGRPGQLLAASEREALIEYLAGFSFYPDEETTGKVARNEFSELCVKLTGKNKFFEHVKE